jgi:hypothetical protein
MLFLLGRFRRKEEILGPLIGDLGVSEKEGDDDRGTISMWSSEEG